MPADEELMRRIADRDMAAFDAMFARHAEGVRRRLARLIRDRAAVEDLVQEVFLRLWTRADQWDGRGEAGAWLGRIATNLALNHLRSGKRRTERLEPPAAEADEARSPLPPWMADPSAVQPLEAIAEAERKELLADLLASLPADKRDVLRLVHEEDRNVREAAEELGIPVGTVKSRLHYARAQLAREWQALIEKLGDI